MPTRLIPLPIEGMDDRDALSIDPKRAARVSNIRTFRDRVERAPGSVEYAPTPIPAASTSGFAVRCGSFLAKLASGAGSQTVTHGLGATPKALLLFTVRNNDGLPAGGVHQNFRFCCGMTDGTTTKQTSASGFVASPSKAYRRYSNAILVTVDDSDNVVNRATFASFNSSTFTIDWTARAGGTAGNQFSIGYIILGGASVAAEVVEWTASTAAGLQAVNHSLGGTPQLGVHICSGMTSITTATDAMSSFGVMSSAAEWVNSFTNADDAKPARAYRQGSSRACITLIRPGAGLVTDFIARFSSWDATTFTINKTNAPDAGYLVATLLINGMTNVSVGNFTQTAEAAPVNQSITDPGFQVAGALFGTCWTADDPGNNEGHNQVRNGIGFMDTENQWALSVNVDNNSTNNNCQSAFRGTRVLADYPLFTGELVRSQARRFSMDSTGFTLEWLKNFSPPLGTATHYYVAFGETTTTITDAGTPRNYFQGSFDPAISVEQAMLFTDKSAWVYNTSSEIYDPTAEAYSADVNKRWSIVNTQDIVAWTRLGVNARQYDGTAFSNLITSGTNHSAKFLLAFNDRIVSGHTNIAGAVDPVQIRWCVNGNVNDWSGLGSGVLEIVETSNMPLTGAFVLGERAYLTKEREIIELIATGELSPVFRTENRVFGTGMLGTHSWAAAEFSAFFLGPDDVYEFDGGRMRSLGSPIYNTMLPFIDYNTIGDKAQGEIRPADSEYHILIEPYIFIYDYRRDRWFWDTREYVRAIGRYTVGTVLTTDVDQSTFMVAGMQDARTLRFTPTVFSFDNNDIDSYFETRDYYAQEFSTGRNGIIVVDSQWRQNTLFGFRFQGTPDTTFEIGMSRDRATNWEIVLAQTNSDGLGIAYFTEPFQKIRFRVRSIGTQAFEVYGPLSYDWQSVGISQPGTVPPVDVSDDVST